MKTTKKFIFCSNPSHINIPDNKNVNAAAKLALSLSITNMKLPAYVFIPHVFKSVLKNGRIFGIVVRLTSFITSTSNVTGCHWGPKQKLRAGYRAWSLQWTPHFSLSSMVSCAFSALCVYLKFVHHPHPLGYLCVKFGFCRNLHCWSSQWRKTAYSLNRSINHSPSLLDVPVTKASISTVNK